MNWFSGWVWLASLAVKSSASTDEDDRAGMGTAFGLDASFGPAEAEGAPPPPAAPPWEHRLARRSGL